MGLSMLHDDLVFEEQGEDFVFQAAEGEVAFREEVAGAASGVQEGQAGQLGLIVSELGGAGLFYGDLFDLCQLPLEVVQEEWVNDFVDVFNAGVVHPARTTSLRVQSAFKDSTKDGGADDRPVKPRAGLHQDQVDHCLAQAGDLDVFIGEQTAVDIGEGGKVFIQIRVPLFWLLVQDLEERDECSAVLGAVLLQIIVELVSTAENTGVFGIQAEHQTDTQGVQAFQRVRGRGVFILL